MQTKHRAAIAVPLLIIALVLAGCSGGVAKPEGWASPVVDEGITYAFQRKESLTAIDQDGNVKWTFPDDDKEPQKDIKLGSVYGTPQLIDGKLYFATYEGDVIAVNAADGALLWLTDIGESVVGAVAIDNGLVATGTTEGNLFVLKTEDGSPAPGWPSGGLDLNRPIWAPVIAKDGILFVASMGGIVRAYNLETGGAAAGWTEFKTDGAIADLALLESGELVVPSLDRHVYFLNSADGSEAYPAVELGDWAWGMPAVSGDTIVLTDISGDVYGFQRGQTEPTWVYSTENRLKSSPAIIGDTVVVADRSPKVHFLDLATGSLGVAQPVSAGGTIRANPTVVDNVAYFITTSGHILKADPAPRTVVEALIGRYRP